MVDKAKEGKIVCFEGISGSGKSTLAKKLHAWLESRGVPCALESEPTKTTPFGKVVREIIEGRKPAGWLMDQYCNATGALLVRMFAANGQLFGEGGDGREWPGKETALAFYRAVEAIENKIRDGAGLSELERQYLFLADRVLHVDDGLRDSLSAMKSAGKIVVLDRYDMSSFAYGGSKGLDVAELFAVHEAVLGKRYLVPDLTLFVAVSPETAVKRLASSGKEIDMYESLENLRVVRDKYAEAIALKRARQRANFAMIDAEQPLEDAFAEVLRTLVGEGIVPEK